MIFSVSPALRAGETVKCLSCSSLHPRPKGGENKGILFKRIIRKPTGSGGLTFQETSNPLHSAGDLAAAKAAGARVGMTGRTVDEDLHALDIGLPSPV